MDQDNIINLNDSINEEENILHVLNLLDLDECVVDETIERIISKSKITDVQIRAILICTRYKHLISLQEETECENEKLIGFALHKLIELDDHQNERFVALLKILNYSIELDKEKAAFWAEHITQQLFASINLQSDNRPAENVASKNIMYLKIIDSIITLCTRLGFRPDYRFINSEIVTLLNHQDELLYKELISTTIPNIIMCYDDYNILNIIWDRIVAKESDVSISDVLTMCTLSDYYFPIRKYDKRYMIKSFLIKNVDFWKLVQNGLSQEDGTVRKYSNYLMKRALDHIKENHLSLKITLEGEDIPYLMYDSKQRTKFDDSWNNFFIILETLEEKQFYLVDSALNLLKNITSLHPAWYVLILKRALKHETDIVTSKVLKIALEYILPIQYSSLFPYKELINVLNKTFIYDCFYNKEENNLMILVEEFMKRGDNFKLFIDCMKSEIMSPIPRFFISYMFMKGSYNVDQESIHQFIDVFVRDTTYTYNNLLIEYGTQHCFVKFCITHMIPNLTNLLAIFSNNSEISLIRHNKLWIDIVLMIKFHCDEQTIRRNILELQFMLYKSDLCNIKCIIKLIMVLFDSSESNLDLFNDLVTRLLLELKNCNKRIYASNNEFNISFFSIIHILNEIQTIYITTTNTLLKNFNHCVQENISGILEYILMHLQNVNSFSDYKLINECCVGIEHLFKQDDLSDILILEMSQILNISLCLIKNYKTNLLQKYFSLKIILQSNQLNDIITDIHPFLNISADKNIQDNGNLISSYNHIICQVQYHYYLNGNKVWNTNHTLELYEYILEVLEKGGSECLLWPIKLSKIFLNNAIKEMLWVEIDFLLDRIWKEILHVRKNYQFKECIEEFIKILYDENFMETSQIQMLCIDYGDRIFELGESSPITVYLFVNHIKSSLNNADLTFLIGLLVKSIIFCNVPRKDQRIEQSITEFIESNDDVFSINHINKNHNSSPYEDIKICTINILMNQKHEFLVAISKNLEEQINSLCKAKHRYHANSMNHRILLRSIQALLLIFKINSNKVNNIIWCKEMLIKQPHHTSIKLFLEWLIALQLIFIPGSLKKIVDEHQLLELPQISMFLIVYHVVKHQLISKNEFAIENFYYAMDLYLPHTMGQLFNIRLYSQYLFTKLYELMEDYESKNKYNLMYETIQMNFKYSSDEKNLIKIKNDFYVNNFDIIDNHNVCDIYHNIPRLTAVSQDEWVKTRNVKELDKSISQKCAKYSSRNKEYDLFNIEESIVTSKSVEDDLPIHDKSAVIQKKFVPWKNMLMEIGLVKKHDKIQSDLIVIASLVDKIPNLGGLSRTCEVFGVKQYVISSLRHLQDRQFQSLSVSSEKWVDVKEVRPGNNLKSYLLQLKEDGYKIVGAEQTSSSVMLNQFSFPKKTAILMGNEKEGVPVDLLHMIDFCVEIPQHGVIRSLNVHVTASIFIWEYARQYP